MREIDVGKTSETLKCLRMQEGIGEDVEVYRIVFKRYRGSY